MEAVGLSEISVLTYKTIRYHNTEDRSINSNKLKTYIYYLKVAYFRIITCYKTFFQGIEGANTVLQRLGK
jgi:hypothetical protein